MLLRRSTTVLFTCCAGLVASIQGDAQTRSRPCPSARAARRGRRGGHDALPYFFVKGGDSAWTSCP